MKFLFLLIFSFFSSTAFGSSCCVSNTGLPNLMVLPVKWQQTLTLSQNHIIGDVDTKGRSTFRSDGNDDVTQTARMDLAYGWNMRYQTGLSFKYQHRERELHGQSATDSGWSDIEFSHAWRPWLEDRLWFFQTLNVPTATSSYNSVANLGVDARGSGTYQLGFGVLHMTNFKEWEFLLGPEIHRSFDRGFGHGKERVDVEGTWGGGLALGAAYVPWRSKTRYGVGLNPKYEGSREVRTTSGTTQSERTLVWDASVNITHTINAQYAVGATYVDQTLFGPARNTLLGRTLAFVFQNKW